MQSRLDRAKGTVEGRGHLFERCAGEESKLDHQAMFFRQVGHGSTHLSCIFGRLGDAIRRPTGTLHAVETARCGWDGGDVAKPPSIQESMTKDAVQPGGEPAAAIESPKGPPRLDQRFLGKIFGPLAVAAKGHRTAPQGRSIKNGKLLKGSRLARLGTVDQFAFIAVGVHRTRDSRIAPKRFTEFPSYQAALGSITHGGGKIRRRPWLHIDIE